MFRKFHLWNEIKDAESEELLHDFSEPTTELTDQLVGEEQPCIIYYSNMLKKDIAHLQEKNTNLKWEK